MLTATAEEIVVTDQPNSARSGSISTPGTARNAAAPTRARNVTAATHQAGWIRWPGCGGCGVTEGSLTDRDAPPGERGTPEGPSPDVTCHSRRDRTSSVRVWLSTTYRRRPRSSG